VRDYALLELLIEGSGQINELVLGYLCLTHD
jgi:hypothetical protein